MDVETALIHRRRLQSELDAINLHGLPIPVSRYLLTTEIARLDQKAPQIKIPVENPQLFLQVSKEYSLRGLSSLKEFKLQLVDELRTIYRFSLLPLPLVYELVWRVIQLLEDRMQLKENEILTKRSPPPCSEDWQKYVNGCINEAIDFVIKNNPEGGRLRQVFHRLEKIHGIEVDDKIVNVVDQRYFEETFPLKSKPTPRRSRL